MSVKVLSSSFVISSPSFELCPPASIPEYVFIGRSNVGKSSLINAICDKQQLAKTSWQPGKTQLINYFKLETQDDEWDIQTWHLVDLPWYWYAKVTRDERAKWEIMIADYMQKRRNIAQIFILIDSRLTPQKLDIEFINQLYNYWQPFSLVYTKSDKVSQKDVSHHIKLMMNELNKTMDTTIETYITSAERKQSTFRVVQSIHELNKTEAISS